MAVTEENVGSLSPVRAIAAQAEAEAANHKSHGEMLAARMPNMVKGAGFARPGGVAPLSDQADIASRVSESAFALRGATHKGHTARADVVKGLNPDFLSNHGFMASALSMPSIGETVAQMLGQLPGAAEAMKNFTLTSPLGTGFVPYDLVAPSRLLYPVFTPLRNKIPRPAGQGTARLAKAITGITGSQTGNQGVVDISMSELNGGSLSSWPLTLPQSGAQTAVDIKVPYRFMGLTESLSWLSQWAGQGFEDIAALANLILLQEFMLGEEYQLIAGTSTILAAPGQATMGVRAAGTGETGLSGITTNVYVRVTATNYFGETTASTVQSAAVTNGQVVDVTIAPSPGALQYNIYVGTGAADPGRTSSFLMASNVGATRYTLQGALPTSGNVPPATDTTSFAATRIEGIVPTLAGHSQGGSNVYPANWQGGYINQSVGTHLSINAINTALQNLYDGTSGGTGNPGNFRADPAEIIGEGGDLMRLSNDIVQSGTATNYNLWIGQAEAGGVRAGAAVSEFVNPVTHSIVKLLVHPFLLQGTALVMSYTLPQAWSNVADCWEMTMVQDYVSIAWPVVDMSYRFSMFAYGGLVAHAPFYSGILQGLQKQDQTPYS